jgi:hypothetical protein
MTVLQNQWQEIKSEEQRRETMSTIRKMQGNRQQDQPSLAEQMLLTDVKK